MSHNTKPWTRVNSFVLILACAGCQLNEMYQDKMINGADKNSQSTTQTATNTMPAEISINEQINGAKADLASRLGVEVNTISVKEARSVQWGSGALGCPKPGISYTQALVPGVRVLLEADSTIYYYHGGKGRNLFNCPAERVRMPAYGPGTEVM